MPVAWIGAILKYFFGFPETDDWKRRFAFFPHITEDGWLIWLVPAWRCFYGSTDWEGSNWSYGWRLRQPGNKSSLMLFSQIGVFLVLAAVVVYGYQHGWLR